MFLIMILKYEKEKCFLVRVVCYIWKEFGWVRCNVLLLERNKVLLYIEKKKDVGFFYKLVGKGG